MSMSREELWEGGWRSQRVVEGKLINPARLLKSGVIAWEYLTDANIPAAAGIKRMSRTTWKAFVNKHFLDRVAEEEQKTCEYCLRIHETAHARYGTPTGLMAHMAYPVQKYLMNLFEDVRCEYLMQGEFPSLVRHFKLLSLYLTEKLYNDSKYGEAKEVTRRKDDVLAQLGRMWDVLRAGATPSPKDDIVQFVVPRIEIVKKGLSGGSKLLSAQVLALILQKLGPSAASSISRKTEVVTEAEREAEEQEELDELEDQVEEESEGQTIQEACDRLGEDGGEGAQTIQQFESVSRDPRWDEVVRVNMEWIMRMSEAMRRVFSKITLKDSRHGDLSLAAHKMQIAYQDSFTDGEVSAKYYRVWRREDNEVDVLLGIDQSGSIGWDLSRVLSNVSIMVAAAVGETPSARLGVFGYGADQNGTTFIKPFAAPSWAGDYTPRTEGGTPMGQAFVDVSEFPWYAWRRRARHVVISITDGAPSAWRTRGQEVGVWEALSRPYYRDSIRVPIVLGSPLDGHDPKEYQEAFGHDVVFASTEAEIATAIVQIILKEGASDAVHS